MPYTLDQFVADARAALQAENNANGREKVRLLVEKLLQNQDFVAATFPVEATVGRHKVHEEPDQGFVVLAHVTGDAGNRRRTIMAPAGRCMARSAAIRT